MNHEAIDNITITLYEERVATYFVDQYLQSVWHDNTINPGYDCKVLVEYTDHNGKKDIKLDLYDADYNHLDSELDWSEVIRWAYVEDLLPNKE